MSATRVLTVIILIAALGGGGWWWTQRGAGAPAGGPPGGGKGGFGPTLVEAAPVMQRAMDHVLPAVGTLKSNEQVTIRPEIAGVIAQIGFDEGAPVEKGQLLIQLDDTTYKAEEARAEASVGESRAAFERASDLLAKNVGSAANRDEAKARLGVAEADVALAKARLAKTRIVAPFAGLAGLRGVSPGDYVAPGQAIVTLADIATLKLDFRVPERFAADVAAGQRVDVTVEAFPGQTFSGEIYAIDSVVEEGSRAATARARLANPDGKLKPGQFARVALVLERRPDALAVPEAAIFPMGDALNVYAVRDGKAELVPVQIGARRDGYVEILDGLKPGERVITAGHVKIGPGADVAVASDAPPGEATPAAAK